MWFIESDLNVTNWHWKNKKACYQNIFTNQWFLMTTTKVGSPWIGFGIGLALVLGRFLLGPFHFWTAGAARSVNEVIIPLLPLTQWSRVSFVLAQHSVYPLLRRINLRYISISNTVCFTFMRPQICNNFELLKLEMLHFLFYQKVTFYIFIP